MSARYETILNDVANRNRSGLGKDICLAVIKSLTVIELMAIANTHPDKRCDHKYEPDEYGVCKRCGEEKHC